MDDARRETGRCSSSSCSVARRKSLDLGQFERFRRVFFTPWFRPLLGHEDAQLVSQVAITADLWRGRFRVVAGGGEDATYEITLARVRSRFRTVLTWPSRNTTACMRFCVCSSWQTFPVGNDARAAHQLRAQRKC